MATVAPPQKATISDTHPFTCNTCQVAFRSSDSQRTHYHTDWHQYNLKRKVAELPPLSSETFAEKVLHAQASTRLERERASFERTCKACNKTYFSENAYANHVGSSKHRQNVARQQMSAIRSGRAAASTTAPHKSEDREDAESVVSSAFSLGEPVGAAGETEVAKVAEKVENLGITDEKEEPKEEVKQKKGKDELLPLEACLFCPYVSPSLTLNVSHMTKAHGLFIPEANYLVDLPGLISYLGKKLVLGNQCLYCNKTKGGLDGIRTHMQDKGHTMLGFETEDQQLELGQFYDFRSTYSDAGEESDDSANPPAPVPTKSKTVVVSENPDDWTDEEDGEGWETDSDASSVDSRDLTSLPVDREPKATGTSRHHMSDGWHSHAHHHVFHDEYELHLPSGRSVGHRSLNRYYRQNLRDHPQSLTAAQLRQRHLLANDPYPNTEGADEEGDVDMEEGGVLVQQPMNRRERREHERQQFQVALRGQAGMVGVDRFKRREVAVAGKRAQAQELRGRRKQEWGVSKVGNNQKHFRDPLLQ